MTESNMVGKPIIGCLSGEGVGDTGLGWSYCSEQDMAGFGRARKNPLFKVLFKINAAVQTEQQAGSAVALLQTTIPHPDRLSADRDTLSPLREGATLVLGEPLEVGMGKIIDSDAS